MSFCIEDFKTGDLIAVTVRCDNGANCSDCELEAFDPCYEEACRVVKKREANGDPDGTISILEVCKRP